MNNSAHEKAFGEPKAVEMGGSLRLSVIVPLHACTREDSERLNALALDVAEAGSGEVLAIAYGELDEGTVRALVSADIRVTHAGVPAFAYEAAANAGARLASGDIVLFVRAAWPASKQWIARLLGAADRPETGAVGPRLLDAGGADETGLVLRPDRFNQFGFTVEAFHGFVSRSECDAIGSACLLTPRQLFNELGGFDEAFGNELASLDYCLRVRKCGRRVVVDAGATFERAASGTAPGGARRARVARYAFAERWRETAAPRDNVWLERTSNAIRRDEIGELGFHRAFTFAPDTTAIVHGPAPVSPDEFKSELYRTQGGLRSVIWACAGPAPAGVQTAADALVAAQRETERRGDGYVAFVRGDTELGQNWLGELIDAIEYAPDTIAATIAPAGEPVDGAMPCSADARCTLVAPRFVPADIRLRGELPLNDALGDWIARAVVAGRDVRRVRDARTTVGPADVDAGFAARWGQPLETYRRPGALRAAGATIAPPAPFASIVMLSWNAPQFTEAAVASIRERTHTAYEIIVIDNGSEPETVARLAQLEDVRILYNAKNTGFAFGCNQGIAAARGTHVVLLNNDVIVSAGWLEALIDVQRRQPAVGMSAPCSNHVGGIQQVPDVPYRSIAAMPAFAALRSTQLRGRSRRAGRAVGFCLCINRRVIDEIGGLDPRYGMGSFEDDDFCLRVRAAGYDIAICEDSFIHHFGEASFRANKLDAAAMFFRNKAVFEQRWGTVVNPGAPDPKDAYDAQAIVRRGFDRARDFVTLPEAVAIGMDWVAPA